MRNRQISTITLCGRSKTHEGHRTLRRAILAVAFGLIAGFCLAKLFIQPIPVEKLQKSSFAGYNNHGHVNDDQYNEETNDPDDDIDINHQHDSHMIEDNPAGHDLIGAPDPRTSFGSHQHKDENSTLAQNLYKEVRVLCWIMTNPKNHLTKAIHVKRTWGKRCNKLLLMSSQADESVGTIALNISEGRNNLWGKTREAFKYIYENHFDEADWFLKADDDTYTVVENLRYFLYPYAPETPIYFGCRFKPYVKQGYMSGGAGYVLSKQAVRLFVEEGLTNPKICRGDNKGAEDVEIGKCLENLNVMAGDSRDHQGRGRFFPFVPESHLLAKPGNKTFWYWKNIYYDTDEGLDCCSDNAISFHYVRPNQMYVYDYLIYHMNAYGIDKSSEDLPEKLEIGATEVPPMNPEDGVTKLL